MIKDTAKQIIIITTGQPSTNPRVVKEYQTLKQRGYSVKVIYSFWANWANTIDEEYFKNGELGRNDFILSGGSPEQDKFTYFLSKLLFKLLRIIFVFQPFAFLREAAMARPSLFLRATCNNYKADLYIAHYPGALPAAMKAAAKYKAPVIFDIEDFHRGESPENSLHHILAIALENKYFPAVNSFSSASPLITEYYHKLFPDKKITTVNNTFSKKYLQEYQLHDTNQMSLFWFSQTIGTDRGLETVITALNQLAKHNITLHLLGDCNPDYKAHLISLFVKPESLFFMEPVSLSRIFEIASTFDIGLATEIPCNENRDICLTNKLFTYVLAGNCIVASDTRAQELFLQENSGIGLIYQNNVPSHLSLQLEKLYNDREYLAACRKRSLELAASKLNWEKESQQFMSNIEMILKQN